MSLYSNKLATETRSRYFSKLNNLGFTASDDPFVIFERSKLKKSTDVWTTDVTGWPSVEFGSIYIYLVQTPGPFTMDNMKAYRSLEAYNYFISGWVQTCYHRRSTSGYSIIAGKVNRSQAVTDTPHQAWVGIKDRDGSVECGHCTCMAGLGEVCSHVAALLFKVECNSRLGHNQVSCTSVPCQWNQTFVKKVEPALLNSISFEKPKRSQTSPSIPARRPEPVVNDPTALLADLKKVAPKAVIFSVAEPKKSEPIEMTLPQILSNMYSEEHKTLSKDKLSEMCAVKFNSLCVNKKQCENLERSTRTQSKSGLWHKYRNGRITASKLYDVCHTNQVNPSESLIHGIAHGNRFTSEATSWGLQTEDRALAAYQYKAMKTHRNLTVKACGFFINKELPHLGATPDSIVECDCCGKGTVEVKCPFKFRDTHPCGIDDKSYCLKQHDISSEDISVCDNQLKYQHRYFYQIQGQLGICELSYCDFVVYTNKGLHVERVLFHSSFFQQLVTKATVFFKNFILPEILCRKIQQKPKEDKKRKQS